VWRCWSHNERRSSRPAVETFLMNDRIRTVRRATDGFVLCSIIYQLKVSCCGMIKCVGNGGSVLKMKRENVVTAGNGEIDMCFV
jgi:hypothetical protein